jgi:hypothetical protein
MNSPIVNSPLGRLTGGPAVQRNPAEAGAQAPLLGAGQPARRSHPAAVGEAAAGSRVADSAARLLAVEHPAPRAQLDTNRLKRWIDGSGGLARAFAGAPEGAGANARLQQNLGGVSLSDVSRMKQIYNLRRGIIVTNEAPPLRRPEGAEDAEGADGFGVPAPQRGRAGHPEVPHDPTEDPIEHMVVNAEIAVGGAELGILGFQTGVGKLSAAGQGSEALGTLFGMMPEIIALRAQTRMIGQTKGALDAEATLKSKIGEQAQLLDRLLNPDSRNAAKPAADTPPNFNALRDSLSGNAHDINEDLHADLAKTIDVLERLYHGQEVSEHYLKEALREFKKDRGFTRLAIAGGGVETAGAIAATTAEIGGHSIPHLVGAAGFGAGAIGGAMVVPFAGKFAYDNAKSIEPHAQASKLGNEALTDTATEKAATLRSVSKPGALKRALAKLAVTRSEPRARGLKAGLFGMSVAGSASGIFGYVAAAAGATVTAGVLATVGMWIGIAALTGFTVYSIGRYVADRRKAGAYTTDALKKVITGEPNPISGPIKTRQTDKLLNRVFFASCEQFAHARIDQARAPLGQAPRDFKSVLEEPLRKHAAALLDPGPYGTRSPQSQRAIDRMIEEIKGALALDNDGNIIAAGFQSGNPARVGASLAGGNPVDTLIKDAVTRALARTLREANQSRTVLVQNRAQFSSAFDRIEDGMSSDNYRITAENRQAVAAVLADFMPDREAIDAWSQAGAPNAPGRSGTELYRLIDDQAADLARAAALRKLLRRDPEALLLTYVQSMRDARLADDGTALAQLRDDLKVFGVTDATLDKVAKASDDTQMFHAAGLLAKELNFMS